MREATTSPAHKRLRTDAAPSVPSAHNGPDQHLRSPSERPRHEGSSGGTGGKEGPTSRSGLGSSPEAAGQGMNSKQRAFSEVKALLNPLLERRLVDRDQFKAAAKAATHMLYRREGAAAHGARPALGEVLADMDLPRAAKAVLQNA